MYFELEKEDVEGIKQETHGKRLHLITIILSTVATLEVTDY